MHDHDEHADHHDHGLPPPEPDNVAVGPVLIWGAASFLFVVVAIVALGSYFWVERLKEDHVKVGEHDTNQAKFKQLHANEEQRLNGYKDLGEGRYQIPVQRAMELVVRDYQKQQ